MSLEQQTDWQALMVATLIPPAAPLPCTQERGRPTSTRTQAPAEVLDRDSQRFLRLEPDPPLGPPLSPP
jgi:hypothetical protein